MNLNFEFEFRPISPWTRVLFVVAGAVPWDQSMDQGRLVIHKSHGGVACDVACDGLN